MKQFSRGMLLTFIACVSLHNQSIITDSSIGGIVSFIGAIISGFLFYIWED